MTILKHALFLSKAVCVLTCLLSANVHSESLNCMSRPEDPEEPVTLGGFSNERAYLYLDHPGLCATGEASNCKASSYVIAGDKIKRSSDCSGFSYIEFAGKKTIRGWISTQRINRNSQLPLIAGSSIPRSKIPGCQEAADLINAGLRSDVYVEHRLPTALEKIDDAPKLPSEVQPINPRGGPWLADVRIAGRPLKAIKYWVGGTCYDEVLDLWDPDLKQKLISADVEEASQDYNVQDIVRLKGKEYLAAFHRDGTVQLSSFDKELNTQFACEVLPTAPTREFIKIGADKDVCKAVASGQVDGTPIVDVPEQQLDAGSFGNDETDSPANRSDILIVSAHGDVDVDNDGKSDKVGILHFTKGAEAAGCGHDTETMVVIKLDKQGTPAKSSFNFAMMDAVNAGEDSRLFRYRGRTYLEARSRADADEGQVHVVYSLSTDGPAKSCELVPIEYRARDTATEAN